jgi:hypothetical protein
MLLNFSLEYGNKADQENEEELELNRTHQLVDCEDRVNLSTIEVP